MRLKLNQACPITGKTAFDTERDGVDIVLGEEGWVWVTLNKDEVVLYPNNMVAAVLMPKPAPKAEVKV